MSLSDKKIKDVLMNGTNRYNLIRLNARDKCKKSGRMKCCEKCRYDKHVEVCHIKAINKFDLETLISEVNADSNLMMLCPNCHWEFDNIGKANKYLCPLCNGKKWRTSTNCKNCTNKYKLHIKKRKVVWPSKDELINLIYKTPFVQIGKKYGVSDSSVKKWCKSYNIKLENRVGYWAKQRCLANKLVVNGGGPSTDERL